MKCLFCKKPIPQERLKKWTKYCSEICNKRIWYIRHNPDLKSYFNHNQEFWKTTTGIGFKWEKWAAKLLNAKHLIFNKYNADLNLNGQLIDVKVSKIYLRKLRRGKPVKTKQKGWWVFNRNKNKPIDYFFCICLLKNKPFKTFLIPSDKFPLKGAVIGWDTKYDKFLFNHITF